MKTSDRNTMLSPQIIKLFIVASMLQISPVAASLSPTNSANEIILNYIPMEGNELSSQTSSFNNMRQQPQASPVYVNDLVDLPEVEPLPIGPSQQMANRVSRMNQPAASQQQQQSQRLSQDDQRVINGNYATYVEPPADFKPIIYVHQKQHQQSDEKGSTANEIPESSMHTNKLAEGQQAAAEKAPPADGPREESPASSPADESSDGASSPEASKLDRLGALKPSVGRWRDWLDMSVEPDLASSEDSAQLVYAAVPSRSPYRIREGSMMSGPKAKLIAEQAAALMATDEDNEAAESRNVGQRLTRGQQESQMQMQPHLISVSRRAVAAGELQSLVANDIQESQQYHQYQQYQAERQNPANQLQRSSLMVPMIRPLADAGQPLSGATKGVPMQARSGSPLTFMATRTLAPGNEFVIPAYQQQQRQYQPQPKQAQLQLQPQHPLGDLYSSAELRQSQLNGSQLAVKSANLQTKDHKQPNGSIQADHKQKKSRKRLKRRRKSKSRNNAEVRIQQLVQQSQLKQQQQLNQKQTNQVNGLTGSNPTHIDSNQAQTPLVVFPRQSHNPQQHPAEFQPGKSSLVVKRMDSSGSNSMPLPLPLQLNNNNNNNANSTENNSKRSRNNLNQNQNQNQNHNAKKRKLKTLLPVGLSSWFLGGIRDLDGRHWHLPSEVISRLAINDVDFGPSSASPKADLPGAGIIELIEQSQPEQATLPPPTNNNNNNQRAPPNGQLIPR